MQAISGDSRRRVARSRGLALAVTVAALAVPAQFQAAIIQSCQAESITLP